MSIRIPPESKLTVHLPMDLSELTGCYRDLAETPCIIRALLGAEAMAKKSELDRSSCKLVGNNSAT